jgi:hypothetical protein
MKDATPGKKRILFFVCLFFPLEYNNVIIILELKEGGRRVNMVEILHTHVCRWKHETCGNYFRNGGGRIKENNGGGESKYCKNFCECYSVPQHNNNTKEKKNKMSNYKNQKKKKVGKA